MDSQKLLLGLIDFLLVIAIFAPVALAIYRFFMSAPVRAIFLRNVRSYFSGLIGYLFIIVFVVVAAICAFRPVFFTNNLANLDALSEFFPMLLLFMVPAIAMGVWADERKQGTDELLFTLPASDFDVLLGKYLAVMAVYSVTLCFSLTQILVLIYLGSPDPGILFATYLGYWLTGAMLLSAGMFASALTSNTTVAFVLGAIICAIPVFSGKIGSSGTFFDAIAASEFFQSAWLSWVVTLGSWIGKACNFIGLSDLARGLSLPDRLQEFTIGTIPVSGLMFFVSFTIFMLYLNLILIRKRHWAANRATNMKWHYTIRTLALAAILISLHKMAFLGTAQADLTSGNIYTLSPTTTQAIDKVDKQHPIIIQAFLSPTVPREYVSVRKRLVEMLRQFDQLGGARIDVRFVDVQPFGKEADEAKYNGIEPVQVSTERDGRFMQENVFLGVVVSSSYDEVVIPNFGPGTPVEYELTRSVSTVSNEKRLRVGVLRTDANLMSGQNNWQIVTELKKQYDVDPVSPNDPIDEEKFDCLIAVMPSSLTDPEMENLLTWVRHGKPTLIFDDPYPYTFNQGFGVTMAPKLPKPAAGGGGMMGMMQQPRSVPKADEGKLTRLLRLLGIAWKYDEIVWDQFNPHPEFRDVISEELVFVKDGHVQGAFNPKHSATSGLQEMMLAFTGTLKNRENSKFDFQPLLLTGTESGLHGWEDFTQFGFNPMQRSQTARIRPDIVHTPDEYSHVLAAHISSNSTDKRNVIFVADIDMVSDWFFSIRTSDSTPLKLDNVTFVLNAVDVLSGDDAYLDLRKRRIELRNLTEVQKKHDVYIQESLEAEEEADKEAKDELAAAKARFKTQRDKIENDQSLDLQAKEFMLRNAQATEQRKLAVTQETIDRKKNKKIEDAQDKKRRQVRSSEDRIRYLAVLLPPIPAFILGFIVLLIRLSNERKNISTDRLV